MGTQQTDTGGQFPEGEADLRGAPHAENVGVERRWPTQALRFTVASPASIEGKSPCL